MSGSRYRSPRATRGICAAAFALSAAAAWAASASPFLAPPQSIDVATTPGSSAVADSTDSIVGLPYNRPTGLDAAMLAQTTAPLVAQPLTTDSAPLAFDPATMLRSSEVRPGQKGYGLTVFNGIRPERFDIEVVGVRHSAMAGMDIILCMLSSPKLKDIGVVAGMSGSPVYVDDKLIGAVAYGWSSNKEALAGVTPIASMLEVFNATPGQQPAGEGADAGFQAYERYMEMQRALTLAGPGEMPKLPSFEGMRTWSAAGAGTAGVSGSNEMEPLSAPVFLSSSNPATVRMARQLFPDMMLTPTGAESASTGGGYVSPSLKALDSPGGAVEDLSALADEIAGGYGIAIPFVEGDLNMAGIGTITYRKGNRLVAFGHPMFQQGVTRFPMAPARIHEVVRSIMRPFKVGEPLGQVGLVTQDRLPAIGGVFGEGADMFPIRAVVDDPTYTGRREFNFRVWNDKEMAPMLAMTVLQEAAANASRSSGNVATLLEYTMSFDDGTSFTKEQYFADTYGGTTAAYMVGADVGVLMTNPFRRVRPSRIDMTMRVAERLPEAQLVVASLDREAYSPGDTVTVDWDMQPYRKERENRSWAFRLPDNLPDGDYALTLSDAAGRSRSDAARNPGGERVFNYESLFEQIKRNYPRNKVYITLLDQDTGVAVQGNEMPKLPASIIGTFEDTVEAVDLAPVRGNLLLDAEAVTAYDVSGTLTRTVTVRRKI